MARIARAGKRFGLTPREIEVVQLLSFGRSRKQIADALKISIWTVKLHIRNVFGKLRAQNSVHVVALILAP